MRFDPRDSLQTTFCGLFFIWGAGSLGVVLTTGSVYMGLFYAVIVGPMVFLIYQTAKAERNQELSHKRDSHRHTLERKERTSADPENTEQ